MDFGFSLSLDEAYQQVLTHPLFAHCTQTDLASCQTFCDIIRQSPVEDIRRLQEALELISYETDNHNEASGFLLNFIALASGFNNVPAYVADSFESIPIEDADKFSDWLISIPVTQRSDALVAAQNSALKRKLRIKDDDHLAQLNHRHVCTLMFYALQSADNLIVFGNYANENLASDFNICDQIHPRLWEVFQSRPKSEVECLIAGWWGEKSNLPHDFFIALEWQREGHIQIFKSNGYSEAVAEFLLFTCEPGYSDFGSVRNAYGVEAIQRHPFLVQDLYEALSKKPLFRWLVSEDLEHRAAYLESLFFAGVLDRGKIVAALESGISQDRDKQYVTRYKKLQQLLQKNSV